MNEKIDILNDKYEFVGTSSKQEAHKKGLWHRVFTCILVNPKHKTILLQKKGSGRYAFNRPDYLDVRDWDYSLQITRVKYKN
jgi:isopentenyldiphosphate isomerase